MSVHARLGWLAHPVAVVSVVVLAVNDHWAKAAYPGVVTGKVSDIAGVVVAALLLSVLLGRRLGLTSTAVGFAALKLVPGVAELAAPLLGGVTRRDPTDLVGLLGLGAAAFATRRRLVVPRALALAVGGLAVLAVTATSAAPSWEVQLLGYGPAGVYARTYDAVMVSTDGVRWSDVGNLPASGVHPPATATGTTPPTDLPSAAGPSPHEVCLPERICYRVAPTRDRIERRVGDGAWTTDLQVTADMVRERFAVPSYQPDQGTHSLWSVVAARRGGTDLVVADFGLRGVLVRGPDGTWVRHGVGVAPPLAASGVQTLLATSLLFVVPMWLIGLMVLVGRVGRIVVGCIAVGVAVLSLPGVAVLAFLNEGDGLAKTGAVAAVPTWLVAILSLWLVRRVRRDRQPVPDDPYPTVPPLGPTVPPLG